MQRVMKNERAKCFLRRRVGAYFKFKFFVLSMMYYPTSNIWVYTSSPDPGWERGTCGVRHSQTQIWSLSLCCHYRLSFRPWSCEFQLITIRVVAATAQSHQINRGDRTGNRNTERTPRDGYTRIQTQGALYRPRTTIKYNQRGKISIQTIQGTHQISTTTQDDAQQIYPNLYLPFIHVSDAEVLARRLIGTCIRFVLTTGRHRT